MEIINKLNEWGANTDTGIKRCANNTNLYIRLVKMIPLNDDFKKLGDTLNNLNFTEGFKLAHAIKGVVANLELIPLLNPISEITELLRNEKEGNYLELYNELLNELDKLRLICNL